MAYQLVSKPSSKPSPCRKKNGDPDAEDFSIEKEASDRCDLHVRQATHNLMDFISSLDFEQPALLVTYFDEAKELQLLFRVLQRLLGYQGHHVMMWCVFMATKSYISFFTPALDRCESRISTYGFIYCDLWMQSVFS